METKPVTVSIVLPCYKEEKHLEPNTDWIISILGMLKIEYELIFVDDCSTDNTKNLINKIIKKYPNIPVRACYHSKNIGRGAAFMTGFADSRGEIVGFFDLDLEISPTYILKTLCWLTKENADLVIARRYYNLQFGVLHRHFISKVYSWLVHKILRIPTSIDSESGFKFFKRSTLEKYVGTFKHSGWFWDTEVVSRFFWDNKKIVSIPMLFLRDKTKYSTVKTFKDSIHYFKHLVVYRHQNSACLSQHSSTKAVTPICHQPHTVREITPWLF